MTNFNVLTPSFPWNFHVVRICSANVTAKVPSMHFLLPPGGSFWGVENDLFELHGSRSHLLQEIRDVYLKMLLHPFFLEYFWPGNDAGIHSLQPSNWMDITSRDRLVDLFSATPSMDMITR